MYIFKEYIHISCLNVAASVSRAQLFGLEPVWESGRGSSLCSFSFNYRAMERTLGWWEGIRSGVRGRNGECIRGQVDLSAHSTIELEDYIVWAFVHHSNISNINPVRTFWQTKSL